MIEYFDKASHIYDSVRGWPADVSRNVTDEILTSVSATLDSQFLELGVGTGRIALPFLERGYSYTGIDTSAQMMAKLSQKVANSSFKLNLLQASATSLPFEDNSFDVVIAICVLHLIPNWQIALREICRVLKSNGTFIYHHGKISSVSPHSLNLSDPISELDRQWRTILESYKLQPSIYGATEAEVLDLLQQQEAKIDTLIGANWTEKRTVKQLINSYITKGWRMSWQISDDIFTKAIADLTAWCQQKYYSLDVTLARETQFKLFVVKNWASAGVQN